MYTRHPKRITARAILRFQGTRKLDVAMTFVVPQQSSNSVASHNLNPKPHSHKGPNEHAGAGARTRKSDVATISTVPQQSLSSVQLRNTT